MYVKPWRGRKFLQTLTLSKFKNGWPRTVFSSGTQGNSAGHLNLHFHRASCPGGDAAAASTCPSRRAENLFSRVQVGKRPKKWASTDLGSGHKHLKQHSRVLASGDSELPGRGHALPCYCWTTLPCLSPFRYNLSGPGRERWLPDAL